MMSQKNQLTLGIKCENVLVAKEFPSKKTYGVLNFIARSVVWFCKVRNKIAEDVRYTTLGVF